MLSLYSFYHACGELANQIADSQVHKSTNNTQYDELFTCLFVTMPMVQENMIHVICCSLLFVYSKSYWKWNFRLMTY